MFYCQKAYIRTFTVVPNLSSLVVLALCFRVQDASVIEVIEEAGLPGTDIADIPPPPPAPVVVAAIVPAKESGCGCCDIINVHLFL